MTNRNNQRKRHVQVNGSIVGILIAGDFEQEFNGYVGDTICLDVNALESAASQGAITVSAVFSLKRKRYTANIDDILETGLRFDSQVCCTLDAFTVTASGKR